MDKSPAVDHIEVRRSSESYLFSLLVFVIIIILLFTIPAQRKDTINFFFHDWMWFKLLPIVFFAGVPGLCVYFILDKSIKVRIDGRGIWTKGNGIIAWETIWYFYSTATTAKTGYDYSLFIKLRDTPEAEGSEIKINFKERDRSFTDIRAVVEFYSSKYNFNDLGHEKK